MLDLRLIREDPEAVAAGLARRGVDPGVVGEVLDLDARVRELTAERDELRRRIKELSRTVGRLRAAGDAGAAEAAAEESRRLGAREAEVAAALDEVSGRLREVMLGIPNLPADDAPDGAGPDDNVVVEVVGERPWEDHQRIPHWETGEALGILDLERAVKLSGSMFSMFRGAGARLARGLIQMALDRNGDRYTEIRPPSLVLTRTMEATGHLPKFADDGYHIPRDDLWAIPTAEVPLTSLARDEILAEDDLPVRMMAYTPCYRREAGAAGRDTRGLLRVHEFDKVELLAYCTPDDAAGLHAEIVSRARSVLDDLGLCYRVVDLCAGDLGFSARRCFDLEVYAPGVDRWLEVSSISWFGDFQARRANIRYRPAAGGGTRFIHTLNGSGVAVPRVWAALVETHRRPDGTVAVPEVLHRWVEPVIGSPR